MKYILIVALSLCASACGTITPHVPPLSYPPPPAVPELSPEEAADCDPLPQLEDGSLKELSVADVKSSLLYKKCKESKTTITEKYNKVKQEQDSYRQQIERLRLIKDKK